MRPTSLRLLVRIRPVSGWVLAGFVGLHTILLLGIHTPAFVRVIGDPVSSVTGGWIPQSLAATLLMVIVLGGFVGGVGGVRWRDLGLPVGWSGGWKLLNAILLTYFVWGLAQLAAVTLGLAGLTSVSPDPSWGPALGTPRFGGSGLAVLFNAAFEEIAYRGFLFLQLWILLCHWQRGRSGPSFLGALVVSQFIFGLNHVPVGRLGGFEGWTLVLYILQVTAVGVFFAVLFLQTNNLYLVIGIHALINEPGLPYIVGVDPSFLVLSLALGLMLVRPVLGHRLNRILGPGPPIASGSASSVDSTLTGSS